MEHVKLLLKHYTKNWNTTLKVLHVVPAAAGAAGAAAGGGATAGGGDAGAEDLGAASAPAGTCTFCQSSPSSTTRAIRVPTLTSAELSGFWKSQHGVDIRSPNDTWHNSNAPKGVISSTGQVHRSLGAECFLDTLVTHLSQKPPVNEWLYARITDGACTPQKTTTKYKNKIIQIPVIITVSDTWPSEQTENGDIIKQCHFSCKTAQDFKIDLTHVCK